MKTKGVVVLRRVSPKTAGGSAVLIGVLLAGCGGVLITMAPVSILGALLLVPATVLVSIGCVWLLRHGWDEPWPPDVRPDLAKQPRIRRGLLIFSGVLLPVAIAYGIYAAVQGKWWALIYSLVLSLNAINNLTIFRKLRAKSTTSEPDGQAIADPTPDRGDT